MLPKVEAWADPDILALPKDIVAQAFGSKDRLDVPQTSTFLANAGQHLVIKRRSELERDPGHVQLVASATLRHQGKYLLIERSPKDSKSARFGRYTLWQRCHVEANEPPSILADAKTQLARKMTGW